MINYDREKELIKGGGRGEGDLRRFETAGNR